MENLIGQQLEQYRIDRKIGAGEMGTVFQGYDESLRRPVAIKLLTLELNNNPDERQRIMEQAQAAARLSHPSIVTIYKVAEFGELLSIVMEYIPGPSLASYLTQFAARNQLITLNQILAVTIQAADALGAAHEAGVLHRDIRPQNILLKQLGRAERPGDPPIRAIVTDFGLAQPIAAGTDRPAPALAGMLPYLSPEQCLAKSPDGRSDLYSLGMVLYQMVTGWLPFEVPSAAEATLKHLQEGLPAVRAVRAGLPEALETIINTATARRPADRYQTAQQMVDALRQASTNLTTAELQRFAPNGTAASLLEEVRQPSATPSQSVPSPIMTGKMSAVRSSPRAKAAPAAAAPPPPAAGDSELLTGYMPSHLTLLADSEQIVISHPKEAPQMVQLNKPVLTIGRSRKNDIVLRAPDVSRQHARLQRAPEGWQFIDLRSTGGTYNQGSKLRPEKPIIWKPGQALGIGPYTLSWRPASGGTASEMLSAARTYFPPASQPINGNGHSSGNGNGNGRSQSSPRVVASPSPTPVPAQPAPAVHVPLPQNSPAPVLTEPTIRAAVEPPTDRFSMRMWPTQLANGSLYRVLIGNEGNQAAIYSIIAQDPTGMLNFDGQTGRLRLTPGQAETINLRVTPKERPYFGNNRYLPFSVQVKTESGQQETQNGQVEVRPVIQTWTLIGIAILLFVFMSSLMGLLLLGDFGQDGTVPVANNQNVDVNLGNGGGTPSGEGDPPAIIDAPPETLPDSDGDGLFDNEEINFFGTDPFAEDSDGDGLFDGDEVTIHFTDPTDFDTDGDGDNDGQEVINGTDPLRPGQSVLPTSIPQTGGGGGYPAPSQPQPTTPPLPTATLIPQPSPTVPPQPTAVPNNDGGGYPAPQPTAVPPLPTDVPPQSGTTTVSLTYLPDSSGWVTASGQVGSGSSNAPRAGDLDNNDPVRGFISFDMSQIPQGAFIEDARLILPNASPDLEQMNNPFGGLGCLSVEALSFPLPLDTSAYDEFSYPIDCYGGPPTDIDVLIDVEDALDLEFSEIQFRFNFELDSDDNGIACLYILNGSPRLEVIYSN